MSEPALAEPPAEEPVGHEHEWRLVSTETDGMVEVREFLCIVCSAVQFDGR